MIFRQINIQAMYPKAEDRPDINGHPIRVNADRDSGKNNIYMPEILPLLVCRNENRQVFTKTESA